jgi:hypothetical protein
MQNLHCMPIADHFGKSGKFCNLCSAIEAIGSGAVENIW